jgi:hypothetical protein
MITITLVVGVEERVSDLIVHTRFRKLHIVISLIPRLYDLPCVLWYCQVETVHTCSTYDMMRDPNKVSKDLCNSDAHLSLSMTPYRLASSVPDRLEAIELVDSELSGEKDMKGEGRKKFPFRTQQFSVSVTVLNLGSLLHAPACTTVYLSKPYYTRATTVSVEQRSSSCLGTLCQLRPPETVPRQV